MSKDTFKNLCGIHPDPQRVVDYKCHKYCLRLPKYYVILLLYRAYAIYIEVVVIPRRRKRCWVEFLPEVTYYKPAGVPLRELEEVNLSVEELEAIN